MPELPNRDPGNLEDRRAQFEQPSSLVRYAKYLASFGAVIAGAQLYGKKKGFNVIAEFLNLTGRGAEYVGNLGEKSSRKTISGLARDRIQKATNIAVDGGGAVLGKGDLGGLRLDEIDNIRDLIDAQSILLDPKNATSKAEIQKKLGVHFKSIPRAGPEKDNFFHHSLEPITFGDLVAENNKFVNGGASTRWNAGESLEINSIKTAIEDNWISRDMAIDPKLFFSKTGETKRVVDTRMLTNAKYTINQTAKAFDMFGMLKTLGAVPGNARTIAMMRASKKGESTSLFIAGDVYNMVQGGKLKHVATGQRLGRVKDALHFPAKLREAYFDGTERQLFDPPKPGFLGKLQDKLGIGRAYQDNPGGLLRTGLKYLRGVKGVATGEAKYYGNLHRTNQGGAHALFGNEIIIPEAAESGIKQSAFHLQAIDQEPISLVAGAPYTKWVDGKPVVGELNAAQAFFHRVKAAAGVSPDVHLATRDVPGTASRELFEPMKRGGVASLEGVVGTSKEIQSVTQLGLPDKTIRNKYYSTSGHVVDRAYDFANYLATRLNTLASSSVLGIAFRPSGNLLTNVGRLAAIPATYMGGLEAAKYADYTMGEMTGLRPSHILAKGYTSLREAQQFARNTLGIAAAAEYVENKALPGINVGVLGTLGAGLAGIATLAKTGSFKSAAAAAGTVYGFIGGPNVGQSTESLQNVHSGEEKVAVRQARWWSMGYQPFAGSKISHYAPGWYAKMKSQPNKTSVYGSEANYWKHGTLLPTFQNLFHLRTFLDPHNTEFRNYRKRPYPVSGGFGEEIPIIGPLFADTIGAIIKPSIRMHEGSSYAPIAQSMISTRGVDHGAAARLGIPNAPIARIEGADPNAIGTRLSKYANVGLEPTGIWKFALQFFGVSFGKDRSIADSGNMSSVAGAYYGMGLGGLGGETEFMRRFIMSDYGKASKMNAQINPIPNTMERWLPGSLSENPNDRSSSYDFTRGDAYSKIVGGEYRLPGAGYDSVNELHGEKYKSQNNVNYKARVTRVIDADTIGITVGGREQKIRFADIQAPEISTPEGKMLTNYLSSILRPGTEVDIETTEDAWGSKKHFGQYGRALGQVSVDGVNLNQTLLSTGWVKSVNQKYDAVDKLLILADVAPFSEAYYRFLNQVQAMDLDEKWTGRVERAVAQRDTRLDTYGFGAHKQEAVAELNLDPITKNIRNSWMGVRENVLSEIPIVGSKLFPKTDPTEHYRKFRVEGDNFANWNKPYETIVRPAVYDIAGDNPVGGTLKAGALAWLLAATPAKMFVPFSPIANMSAAAIPSFVGTSAVIGGGLSSARALMTGQMTGGFTPNHIKQEREFDEWHDMIQHKKYSTLQSLAQMRGESALADMFSKQVSRTRVAGIREIERTGETSVYASTLSAVDRAYFETFVSEPAERREKILNMVPEHMRNALSSVYGKTVDSSFAEDQVEEYFEDHFLPSTDWAGWSPDVPADALKIRGIQQGFGFMSDSEHRHDFYPSQISEADYRYPYLTEFPFSVNSEGDEPDEWIKQVFKNSAFSKINFGMTNISTINTNLIDNRNSDVYYFSNDLRQF